MVKYIPTKSKSILNKHKFVDDWTASKSSMNLYRGCEHACVYCDGRNEKYYVKGDFGEDIKVKVNAAEILKKELSKIKKPEILMLGGGVGDLYQPAEEQFCLTRKTLEIVKNLNLSCQILTKSALIERDFDLICEINKNNQVIVCFSISLLKDKIWQMFEPKASSPKERLKLLKLFSKAGVPTGVWFMPIIPFICDDDKSIEEVIKACCDSGVKFVLPAGMTLKKGKQKEYFVEFIEKKFPELVPDYKKIYPDNKWGNPEQKSYSGLMKIVTDTCHRYGLPTRIPYNLFKDKIELKYEISIILSQIAYLLELKGKKTNMYRRAALNIQKENHSLIELSKNKKLTKIRGVGKFTEKLIEEIINKRRCSYYEKLWKETVNNFFVGTV